jgi:tetratricopeptide (TPR) repeat protein
MSSTAGCFGRPATILFLFYLVTVDGESLFAQASKLHKAGAIDDALVLYNAAIAAEPQLPNAYFASASVFYRKGLAEDALLRFRKTVELAPGKAEPTMALGTLLSEMGLAHSHEAATTLKAALGMRSLHKKRQKPVQHALSRVLSSIGRFEEAAQLYRLLDDGSSPDIQLQLALALSALGKHEKAASVLNKGALSSADTSSLTFEWWEQAGGVLSLAGRQAEAQVLFHQALALRPQLLSVYGQTSAHNRLAMPAYFSDGASLPQGESRTLGELLKGVDSSSALTAAEAALVVQRLGEAKEGPATTVDTAVEGPATTVDAAVEGPATTADAAVEGAAGAIDCSDEGGEACAAWAATGECEQNPGYMLAK